MPRPISYGLVGVALFATSSAFACSPVFLDDPQENKPVVHGPSCEFEGGGRHDWISGGPAHDLGKSRVYQIVWDVHSPETAIVSDCASGQQIAVYNKHGEETSCGFWSKIEIHLVPKGRIDLSKGRNLKGLTRYLWLRKMGTRDVWFQLNNADFDVEQADVPDFSCACRLYYPDSPGAQVGGQARGSE